MKSHTTNSFLVLVWFTKKQNVLACLTRTWKNLNRGAFVKAVLIGVSNDCENP